MRFSQDFLTFVEYWTQRRATTEEEEAAAAAAAAAALPEAARSAFKAKKTLLQFLLTRFL
jgi:hypothetical protein